MARMVIRGLGLVFSGDMSRPLLDADSILVEDGRIAAIGHGLEAEQAIEAHGCAVMPGLIDNHVHPAFGDWTPRQNQLGWIEAMVHGGATTLVSAGEVHIPGRPRDPVGVKALAIAAQRCFSAFRPMGARVLAGAPVPERGLTEADYREMAAAGVRWLGEIGLGSVKDEAEVVEVSRRARAHRPCRSAPNLPVSRDWRAMAWVRGRRWRSNAARPAVRSVPSSGPRLTASSRAVLAPCPIVGTRACAASPMSTVRPRT